MPTPEQMEKYLRLAAELTPAREQMEHKLVKSTTDHVFLVEDVVNLAIRWYKALQAARMGEELVARFALYDATKKLAEHRQ